MKLPILALIFVLSFPSIDLFSSCCCSYRKTVPKPIHTRYHPKVTKVAHYEKALQREYQLGGRNVRKINLLKQRISKEKPDYDLSGFFAPAAKASPRRIDQRVIAISEDKIRDSIDRLAKLMIRSENRSKNGLPMSVNLSEKRQYLTFVNTERRKMGKAVLTMDDLLAEATAATRVIRERRQANLRQVQLDREEALRRLDERVAPIESIRLQTEDHQLLADVMDTETKVVSLHPEAEKKIRNALALFNRLVVEVSSDVRSELQGFVEELKIDRV